MMKNNTSSQAIFAAIAMGCFGTITHLNAQDSDAVPDQVVEIVKSMAGLIEEADEFAFQAEILFDEILDNGQAIQHEAEISAVASRPNHLAARYEGDENSRSLWIADDKLTAFHESAGIYSKVDVPKGIKPALDHLMEKYDVSLPLADFVIDGVYESLMENVENAVYAGKSEVDGHVCHQISCSQEFIDWQLWIDDGLLPLPRKVLITYKAVPGVPRYAAVFSKWDLETELPDSTFEPKIPSEATEIDLLDIKRGAE